MATAELYLGFGVAFDDLPTPWVIILNPLGKTYGCTWYWVTGSPFVGGKPYERKIRDGQDFDSPDFKSKVKIGTVTTADWFKIVDAVTSTPAEMPQCWALRVIDKLEQKGLVLPGTAADFVDRIEPPPKRYAALLRRDKEHFNDSTPWEI